MNTVLPARIDPGSIAFDIDGVVADTMTLFLDIAKDEFNVNHIRYDDITSYDLSECLALDLPLLETITAKIISGDYQATLMPIAGAAKVLKRIAQEAGPLLFVTARPYPGPIQKWLENLLADDGIAFEVVTTGGFDTKTDVLNQRNISFFIEDRLETCFTLHDAGITPIVFTQPWNRKPHSFTEVTSWPEVESLIHFEGRS